MRRVSLHDRFAGRQRPYSSPRLRDTRCRECQMQEASLIPATCREACIHERDFPPTPNRFSILAQLDQSPTQTEWAFDFIPTSESAPRRRGKRGGRSNKLKLEARRCREARKSEGVGELCEKLAALGLDVEPSNATTEGAPVDRQNAVPRSNFNLSTGTVRHRWMPQFRTNPDSSLSSNVVKPITQEKTTVPQPPERCLTKATASLPAEEAAETRCKESRFFPLSAFLASPPAVARHSTSAKPSQPAPTHQDTKEKQLAITPSTVAQRAAARAACRALASGAASSAGPCVSLSTPISLGTHTSESAIPLQSSQISNPAPLLAMPEKYNHPSMDPPSTPLPITPPHTTTPTLTTSPAIPSHPYMAPSDSVISALPASQSPNTPPPLPLRPQVTSSTPQSWTAVSATGSSGPTSPLVLITAPVTSPHPFVTPPRPNPTVVAIPAMPKPFAPAVPIIPKKDVVPTIPKQQEIAPTSSVTQTELQDFLERGHADPCWCSRPSSTFCGPACATKVPSSQTQNKLTILRKRTFNEFELDTEIATMLGATSLSPTPQSTESEFEDLGYHGDSILTPASTDEEDDWDVVSAAEWFSRPRVCSIDTYQPTFEPEIVASPPFPSTATDVTDRTINSGQGERWSAGAQGLRQSLGDITTSAPSEGGEMCRLLDLQMRLHIRQYERSRVAHAAGSCEHQADEEGEDQDAERCE